MFLYAPGGSVAVGPTSGGKVYAYNDLGVSPMIVANANPQRASITFINPGTIMVYISPVNIQALNTAINTPGGSNQVLTPSPSALGGCFPVYPNGGVFTLNGENQGAMQAFALSGSTNPLTVMESNIA